MAVTDDMLEINQSQLAAFHNLLMSSGLNRNLHKQRRRSYRLFQAQMEFFLACISYRVIVRSLTMRKRLKTNKLNFSLFVEVIINHCAHYIHNANILVYTQEYLL